MQIRRDQMAIFDERAEALLTSQMVDHLENFAPKHSEVIGRENVKLVVQTGISRARAYGFTLTGPIRFFAVLYSRQRFGGRSSGSRKCVFP